MTGPLRAVLRPFERATKPLIWPRSLENTQEDGLLESASSTRRRRVAGGGRGLIWP
jgi:hypothetical protein